MFSRAIAGLLSNYRAGECATTEIKKLSYMLAHGWN